MTVSSLSQCLPLLVRWWCLHTLAKPFFDIVFAQRLLSVAQVLLVAMGMVAVLAHTSVMPSFNITAGI